MLHAFLLRQPLGWLFFVQQMQFPFNSKIFVKEMIMG